MTKVSASTSASAASASVSAPAYFASASESCTCCGGAAWSNKSALVFNKHFRLVSTSASASTASVSVSAPAYFASASESCTCCGGAGRKKCTGLQQTFPLGLHFNIRFYCFCFSFSPSLLCHLPQSRALAAGEQPGRIKVHWSSAKISAWFPLLLQLHLLLLFSI